MKRLFTITTIICACLSAYAQKDTLYVSELYTTHIKSKTNVTYADLSNPNLVLAKITEDNKQLVALRAREPFTTTCSLTLAESNGDLYTYVVAYDQHPKQLIVDKTGRSAASASVAVVPVAAGSDASSDAGDGRQKSLDRRVRKQESGKDGSASNLRYKNAPTLEDIYEKKQDLFHLGQKNSKVFFCCANIYTYSDITYVTLIIRNASNISYEAGNASFTIESRKKTKRTVSYQDPVMAKSNYGSLIAEPGGEAKICYALPKLTLSKDQCLCIYLNEISGERNFILKLIDDDVNNAILPF